RARAWSRGRCRRSHRSRSRSCHRGGAHRSPRAPWRARQSPNEVALAKTSREAEIHDDVAARRVRIRAHLVSTAEKCFGLIARKLRDLGHELDLKAESCSDGPELDVR